MSAGSGAFPCCLSRAAALVAARCRALQGRGPGAAARGSGCPAPATPPGPLSKPCTPRRPLLGAGVLLPLNVLVSRRESQGLSAHWTPGRARTRPSRLVSHHVVPRKLTSWQQGQGLNPFPLPPTHLKRRKSRSLQAWQLLARDEERSLLSPTSLLLPDFIQK